MARIQAALVLDAFNGRYGVGDVQLLMAAIFITMLPGTVLLFGARRCLVDTGAASEFKG